MVKRRLFLNGIIALFILLCSISCSDREDVNEIMQENYKSETKKSSSLILKDTVTKSSKKLKSESAIEGIDSLGNVNEIQDTREPRRLQPDPETEPGGETIDPTKPDRPK